MDNLRRNGTQHTRQMTSTKETASSWQTGYIDVHLTFLFQNRREETLCQGTTVVMYSPLHSSLPIALPDQNIYGTSRVKNNENDVREHTSSDVLWARTFRYSVCLGPSPTRQELESPAIEHQRQA
jgi:hypothetical protein